MVKCEIDGTYCATKKLGLAATLNVSCLRSENAACLGFHLWEKHNQYSSQSLLSVCWWTGSSGPDGLQLGGPARCLSDSGKSSLPHSLKLQWQMNCGSSQR